MPRPTPDIPPPNPAGFCLCGCGERTPLSPQSSLKDGRLKGHPTRYCLGHGARKQRVPPNPTGLCLCGCGQKTSLARASSGVNKTVKGEPVRYIKGHHLYTSGSIAASRPRLEPPNPSGLCFCGCGGTTLRAESTDSRWLKVKGEHLRYIYGHQGRRYHDIPKGFMRCSACKETLPESEFYRHKPGYQNVRTGYCKTCHGRLDKTRFKERTERAQKVWRLKYQHGLAFEEYEALRAEQSNLCAICRKPQTERKKDGTLRELHVDHDHATGKVRALLCGNCNRGIGLFDDDIPRLQAAIRYLKKHR